MRRQLRRLQAAALTLATLTVLTACGDGGTTDSSTRGTATAPATPSATPTVTTPAPPTMPPEAMRADVAGAEAFIGHYLDTVNYAYSTGDVRSMQVLQSGECIACASIERTISEGYSHGRRIEGGQLHVHDVVVTPGDPEALLSAVAVISQDNGVIRDAETTLESSPPLDKKLYRLLVKYEDRWRIEEMGTGKNAG